MSSKYLFFSAARGINNKVDPVRLVYDRDTGVQDLASAVNVDLDQTGRPDRRKGSSLVAVLNDAHSVWSDRQICFVAAGTSLYRVLTDHTLRVIRADLTENLPVSFVRIARSTYYMNGMESGIVVDDMNYPWIGNLYDGPDEDYVVDNTPPIGTKLAYFNSRMLIVDGTRLWFSKLNAYSWYRKSVDYVWLPSNILMVQPLNNGVWLSDEHQIYWLAGRNAEEWVPDIKSEYPALAGRTEVLLASTQIKEMNPGTAALWMSNQGLFLGTDMGEVINLTEQRLTLPTSVMGTGVLHLGKYFVALQ